MNKENVDFIFSPKNGLRFSFDSATRENNLVWGISICQTKTQSIFHVNNEVKIVLLNCPPSTLLTANPGGDGGGSDGADGYSGGGADYGGNGGEDGGDGDGTSSYYGGSGSGLDISTIPLKNVVIR